MSTRPAYVASTARLLAIAESITQDWDEIGASGHFLARNLDTGEELGFDVDVPCPLASVIKVPVALAALERIAAGTIDPAQPITIDPATKSVGSTGVSAFRYPATVAVGDLLYQMLTISDNSSADAVLGLIGIDGVRKSLADWGCTGIRMRHRLQRMFESATGAAGTDFGLALELAIRDDATG